VFRGIVEGFYGKPFLPGQRRTLINCISRMESPSYLYAPKNDPFHRVKWRDSHPHRIMTSLSQNMKYARSCGVDFMFGISPWGFSSEEDSILRDKAEAALDAGASGIAVLFDDIPEKASGNLARMQLEFARSALCDLDCPIITCPSIYCLELLVRLDGADYLEVWRKNVPKDWDVFWTGNEVISRLLDEHSLGEATRLLGKKPVIWDNLLADDYCLRRVYLAGLKDRIPFGYDYFLNPSAIFPVALHGAMELVSAAGVSRKCECEWPEELGPHLPGWELLSEFHHLPWEPGETGAELLKRMENGYHGKDEQSIRDWLDESSKSLIRLSEALEEVEGGFDLMPIVLDLSRFFSILTHALSEPAGRFRNDMLNHLLLERLPFEHPLAEMTRGLLDPSTSPLHPRRGRGEEN
jgi:hypothetical protein